jgi:hypothetical protein
MTLTTDAQTNELEIKRYLYDEMTDEERAAVEEKLFEDDELFFEIADTENRLVDLYAREKLTGEELKRFERSLEKLPERQAKVANAVALQALIDEERTTPAPVTVVVRTEQTFWQKLSEFFNIKSPAFGYAMTALVVLFTLSSALLLLDNRRKADELARLQNEQNGNQNIWQQREQKLQIELANLRETFDRENQTSSELSEQLENKQARIEQLQLELERIRRETNAAPIKTQPPSAPIIASFFLLPSASGRGGNGGADTRQLTIERATKRISMRLALPKEIQSNERFSVQLNEKVVAQNLPVRTSSGGQISLQVSIPAENFAAGLNKLAVFDKASKEVSKYIFNIQKK